MRARFLVVVACLAGAGCAGTIAPPKTVPQSSAREALVILPGFGYSNDGERAIRALEPAVRNAGLDLYLPKYIQRSGLESSRGHLRRFLRDHRIDRYERVHVFAFLAGAWTFNSLADDASVLPNLASVVYDRSPYQERAPRIAASELPLLSWLRYGPVLSQLAKAPYPSLPRANVRVGLIVETVPTGFVKRFKKTADSYGPYSFDCSGFGQAHADCIFAPLSHDDLYVRFAEVWPEVRTFVREGRFTASANRSAPR